MANRKNYLWLLVRLFLGICLIFNFAAAGQLFKKADSSVTPVLTVDQNSPLKQICSAIYRGDFNSANQIAKKSDGNDPAVGQLETVISRYETVNSERQLGRQKAYQKQLDELSKMEKGPDANKTEPNKAAEPNKTDDVNNISKIFLIITKACEYADKEQKEVLLAKPFVKQTIEKAKAKAAEFESQGKWLDSYLIYYTWIKEIYKNDKHYSDYAEELLDKATVVSSFQDSPCETSQERYAGVKKEMFNKAIDILSFYYVKPMDYREMSRKALERCRMLGEVIKVSYPEIKENQKNKKQNDIILTEPNANDYASWSSGLADMLSQTDELTGIGRAKFTEIFDETLKLNDKTLKLPESILIAHFCEAALSALDPYTNIIWPQQVQEFERSLTNEFTGIGIEISKQEGLLTAVSLLPDTPAYRSGLDAGDIIEAVNGVSTKDMSLICAVRNITGPEGTKVTLTVRRPHEDKTREITITRAKIIVQTIRGWQRTENGKWLYMIDQENKIGYVRLTSFSDKTSDDLEKVLIELEKEGLKGLILDLRLNTGGLLSSAKDVADKFLEKGLIVRTQPRFGTPTYLAAEKEKTHPDYPLVILIDQYSASASEIVAGALQDPKYSRAIIVGERSHGKGSVQTVIPDIGGGAQLKYTMAYYYLPSGQKVESKEESQKEGLENWGIGPNVEIKLRSDELKEKFDIQKDNDVLFGAGHTDSSQPVKRHTLAETLTSDPQLEVAILIAKTKLIEKSLSINPN